MAATYSISEAQARFPAVVREAAEVPVALTRRDKVVGYILSPERMEGILETMEILANPDAMKLLTDYEKGSLKLTRLSARHEKD